MISVLAGGKEVNIKEDNLDLGKKFSLSTSNGYPATMTSLAFEVLGSKHPSITFIHEFPGFVSTPLLKTSMGRVIGSVISLLTKPISMSPEESGEWQVYLATSPSFPAKMPLGTTSSTEKRVKLSASSNGEVGGGVYILQHNGRDATNQAVMIQLRANQLPEKIWKHTLATFDRLLV